MGWKRKLKKAYKQEMAYPEDKGALSKYLGIQSKEKPKKYRDPSYTAMKAVAITALVAVVAAPAAVVLATSFKTTSHLVMKQKKYRQAELTSMKAASLEVLNKVQYANRDFALSKVNQQFADDVNAFASALQNQFTEKATYLYSPYTAYLNLDLVSLASRNQVAADCESVLGTYANRGSYVIPSIETNFYTGDNGSAHVYQGAFFQKNLEFQSGYLDKLASRRAETYRLDMNKDLAVIPAWANEAVGADLLTEKDLDYKANETIAYYLSILEFEGKWASVYNDTKTKKQPFKNLAGEVSSLDFMDHTITFTVPSKENPRTGVYDYGDYVSAYDHYKNGYSIQYLTPKEAGKDIFAILKGKNFFVEDLSKLMKGDSGTPEVESDDIFTLEFIVPKFNYSSMNDITPKIKALGLASLYENLQDSIGGGLVLTENGGALAFTKQVNSIEFSETGTIAKSITFSAGYGAAAPILSENTYVIKLDEPFVYVIRDPNGLPLFVGGYNG